MMNQLPDSLLLRCIQKTSAISFARLRCTCKGLYGFVEDNVQNLRIPSSNETLKILDICFGVERVIEVEIKRKKYKPSHTKTVSPESIGGYFFENIRIWKYHYEVNEKLYEEIDELMKRIKSVTCDQLEFPRRMNNIRPEALAKLYRTIKFNTFYSSYYSALYDYPQFKRCNKISFRMYEGEEYLVAVFPLVGDYRERWQLMSFVLEDAKLFSMDKFYSKALPKIETDFVIELCCDPPVNYQEKWLSSWEKMHSRTFEYIDIGLWAIRLRHLAHVNIFLKRGSQRDVLLFNITKEYDTNVYVSSLNSRSVESILSVLDHTLVGGNRLIPDFSSLYDKWIDYKGKDLFYKLFADFQALWLNEH